MQQAVNFDSDYVISAPAGQPINQPTQPRPLCSAHCSEVDLDWRIRTTQKFVSLDEPLVRSPRHEQRCGAARYEANAGCGGISAESRSNSAIRGGRNVPWSASARAGCDMAATGATLSALEGSREVDLLTLLTWITFV
jgi:endogenous inhibitor of DNA gyrase (YacG/DUF329 family)